MDNKLANFYEENYEISMLLQLDPTGIGAAFDVYFTHLLDMYKKKRYRKFFSEIARRKIKFSKEMIESDDFLFAFFSTTKAVEDSRTEEKIILFANFFVHGVETKKYKDPQFEQFLVILKDLTFQEINILDILFKLEEATPKTTDDKESEVFNKLQIAEIIWSEFESAVIRETGVSADILKNMLTRMNRTGLFENITGTVWDYEGGKGSTTELYSEFRNWIIESKPC